MSLSLRAKFTIGAVLVSAIIAIALISLFFYFSLINHQTADNPLPPESTSAQITPTTEFATEAKKRSRAMQWAIIGFSTMVLLALGGACLYYISGKLIRPINRLTEHTGQLDRALPPEQDRINSSDEIGTLARTIYAMAADLELQNRSVKYLAFHDPLTGLSNRTNFQMRLEDAIVDTANHRKQLAMMYLDIDDFKEINDTRGHEYGDRALRTIANRLNTCLEENCTQKNLKAPMVARMGGDEFTILVTGKLERKAIAEIAESLLNQLHIPLEIDGDVFQLSGSIGIAFYPNDALSASSLFNSSDIAMYASKSAGKGTYRFFDDSMSNNREHLGQIKSEFKSALASQKQLSLVYQPVVDINNGRVVGAEALIRWNHPKRGLLLPSQFISIVEHNEIALETDLWVLEQVLSLLEKIDLQNKEDFLISTNISASNLAREQFSGAVSMCLASKKSLIKHLQLEVTETYLHRDEAFAKKTLEALKETGVAIWLDDFGTGYSSLNHLCIFPVDGIKIDRQFINQLDKKKENHLLVTALIGMSTSFEIELIAEGIDNMDDLKALQRLGCKHAQGFLFSKPISEEEFLQLLEEDRHLMEQACETR